MVRKFAKAYPQLKGLTSFQLDFAEEVDKRHPTWLTRAKTEEWCGETNLVIKLENDPRKRLFLQAEYAQLTLHFSYWHAHFFPQGRGMSNVVSHMLEDIQGIQNENLLAVITSRTGEGSQQNFWIGIYTVEQYQEIDKLIIHVRSWNGTYDYDHPTIRFPYLPEDL